MSLSTALNIISSSFTANAAQTAVVSGNIANANTTGYSRQIANLATNSYGGADVVSVTRIANAALTEKAATATAQAASAQAISDGLAQLAATVSDSASATSTSGATEYGNSPSALIGNLQNALTTYQASPTSTAAADAVVTAAKSLTSALNTGSQTVETVREQADANMASSVDTINTLLTQFTDANNAVVSGLAAGTNVASAQDTRDSIVSQLSQQIGVQTTVAANGSMAIYTDSGVTLFQVLPRSVTFDATAALPDGTTGEAVKVDGAAITGPTAILPIQSGALAGYAALRDNLAPLYQQQLDQIAGGLISAFSEGTGTASATNPWTPGLFTAAGVTSVPFTVSPGLAAAITVNANVDSSQNANADPDRIRDGQVSAATYTPSTATSNSSNIQALITALGATRNFDPSKAGLSTHTSLTDYAGDSVSWLNSQAQTASDASTYQSALATSATAALSNATGVNLDSEMTTMLALENSYATTAKLLTTAQTMFQALLEAA